MRTIGTVIGIAVKKGILFAAIFLPGVAGASSEDVDALVEAVRQEALLEAAHDEERIDRFLTE